MSQVTTLSFFTYKGFLSKVWAFTQMQFGHKPLSDVDGLIWYKLMGTGKGKGFNPLPDWSTYSFLQVWRDQSSAKKYFASKKHQKYINKTSRIDTWFLEAYASKGKWDGGNPFELGSQKIDKPIAVITRATIKFSQLIPFWKYVPRSQKGLFKSDDLLYTKGVGEIPFRNMATFSVWKNIKSLENFAYQNRNHQGAIKLTRKRDWYKEEMFTRFNVLEKVVS